MHSFNWCLKILELTVFTNIYEKIPSVAAAAGLEPATVRLTAECSTIELHRTNNVKITIVEVLVKKLKL